VSIIALLVSIVAVIVSVWTSWRQDRLQRRQTDLQERLFELEMAREHDRLRAAKSTSVVASLEREKPPGATAVNLVMRVANTGQAEARDIHVVVDGTPIAQHEMFFVEDGALVTRLGSGAGVSYLVVVPFGSLRVIDVHIGWTNESGERSEWQSQLAF
jgi:hypothetical protein